MNQKKKIKDGFKQFIEYIENESVGINYDLFKDYFNFIVPSALVKKLYKAKNKNKNNELVEERKERWSNLRDEIKKMPEDEKKIEQPNRILRIVKEFLSLIKRLKSKV